jgi:ABC-type multidrug transport system fused ATPase/permease subunit
MAKYGEDIIGNSKLGDQDIKRMGSSWWRDICRLVSDTRWFNSSIRKRLVMGRGQASGMTIG